MALLPEKRMKISKKAEEEEVVKMEIEVDVAAYLSTSGEGKEMEKDSTNSNQALEAKSDELPNPTPNTFHKVISVLYQRKYIKHHTLFQLRFLSKTCKQAVNDCLEQKYLSSGGLNRYYEFFKQGDAKKFAELTSSHPALSNPFVNRAIVLREDNRGDQWACYRAMFPILVKFGQHIWHCDFRPTFTSTGVQLQEQYYLFVRRFLVLMPNLKTIILGGMCFTGVKDLIAMYKRDPDANPARVRGESVSSTLETYIKTNHIPVLEHLKTICIEADPMSELVLYELLSKCPNLEIFRSGGGDRAIGIGILKDLSTRKSNIESLHHGKLEQFSGNFYKKSELQAMNMFIWPQVNAIDLTLNGPSSSTITVEDVFRVLDRFKSLEIVNLDFMYAPPIYSKSKKQRQPLALNLPNVTKFFLMYNPKPPIPMDFLLGMANSLECLSLTLTAEDEKWSTTSTVEEYDDESSTIKIYSCWNVMYNSNIWELFPKLKHVSFLHFSLGGDKYTRREYEKEKLRNKDGEIANENTE